MIRILLTCGLIAGLMLAIPQARAEATAPVETTDNPVDTAATDPEFVESPNASAEISTEMEGLDSLDVLPHEMVTSFDGGTRRINLESSVFRREEPVYYERDGNRDPFRALIRDEKKEGEIETDLLRLENAVLTGVVWSEGEYLALVKDKDGKSFFLREGDPVYQGRVLSVTQSRVELEVTEFGDYERVTLKING
ncbi:MAG: hypothetical protein ACOZB3_07810 [Calditrichota bacterium]